MAKFRKRPIVVDAEQFFYSHPALPGVFYPPLIDGIYVGDAFVVTAHGQRVYLQNGDWVIAEADGEHYYPCKDEIFAATYEPADMPDALAAMTARAEQAEAKLAAVPVESLMYCWYSDDGEREDDEWERHADVVGDWMTQLQQEAQP